MGQHSLASGPEPDAELSDDVIALIRTIVPVAYGALAAWLIGLGIPSWVLSSAHAMVITAMTALLSAAWYAVWQRLQSRVPAWLVVVALGYAAAPSYPRPDATAMGEYGALRRDPTGPGTGQDGVPGLTSSIQLPGENPPEP